jgi:hypothetical protein
MSNTTSPNPHQRPAALTQDWQPEEFAKSSYSGANQGGCVEFARRPGVVAVRNSNHSWEDGPVVEYTDHEWATFLRGAKDGEFDLA